MTGCRILPTGRTIECVIRSMSDETNSAQSDTPRRVARRVIWFEPPAEALADPVRFMVYAMSHATHDDMQGSGAT